MAVRSLRMTGISSSAHGFTDTSVCQQIQFAIFSLPEFPFLQYSFLQVQGGNGGLLYVRQPHFGLVSLLLGFSSVFVAKTFQIGSPDYRAPS
jgi:hypothetical protein